MVHVLKSQLSNLSEKRDWLLTHGVGITYVGLDDFGERFLDSLEQYKIETEVKTLNLKKIHMYKHQPLFLLKAIT